MSRMFCIRVLCTLEVRRILLRACNLYRQDLPKALLVYPDVRQQRHARHTRSRFDVRVGGVQVEVRIVFLLQRVLPQSALLLFETTDDAACGVLANLHLLGASVTLAILRTEI